MALGNGRPSDVRLAKPFINFACGAPLLQGYSAAMNPRHTAAHLFLWLLPLALLLLFGAAMIADVGGAAAGFGHLLNNIFGRFHPTEVVVTNPAGDPASGNTLQPGAWLDNATVLWPALLFLLLS